MSNHDKRFKFVRDARARLVTRQHLSRASRGWGSGLENENTKKILLKNKIFSKNDMHRAQPTSTTTLGHIDILKYCTNIVYLYR